MINVEEALALQSKQTAELQAQVKQLHSENQAIWNVLYTAFPSIKSQLGRDSQELAAQVPSYSTRS